MSTQKSDAPKGSVWVKQIFHTLCWLLAFVEKRIGAIERVFLVSNYSGQGSEMRMITDASPWGLGGIFAVDRWIIGYFSVEIMVSKWTFSNILKVMLQDNKLGRRWPSS